MKKMKNFIDVLEALLQLSKKTRIRISSIEPTTIDNQLIQLWKKYPNFCKYLHLPIQSATNEILSRMRRKYTLDEYHNYLMDVFNNVPDICLGTDVIVGFPGETKRFIPPNKKIFGIITHSLFPCI